MQIVPKMNKSMFFAILCQATISRLSEGDQTVFNCPQKIVLS